MKKSQLTPLDVPWAITTSSTDMQISMTEQAGLKLQFVGNLLVNMEDFPNVEFLREVPIREDMARNCGSENKVKIVGVTITVQFGGVTWFKSHPFVLEKLPFIEDYSVDEIDPDFRPFELVEDESKWHKQRERLYCEWIKTSTCPMPYAFEISNSKWLSETQTMFSDHVKLHHYLFRGSEISVEAISTEMNWETHVQEFHEIE